MSELNEAQPGTPTAANVTPTELAGDVITVEKEHIEAPVLVTEEFKKANIFVKAWRTIKLPLLWGVFCIRQSIAFIFTSTNEKEGLIQFLVRQCVLSDSKGNPSWTVTILVYTMVLVAYVFHYSTKLAFTPVAILDPATGKIIGQGVAGYKTELFYLLISLSVIITTAFNAKSAAAQTADTGVEPVGIVSKLITSVGSVITSMKGLGK